MNIIWGVVLILFTLLLCWLGQVINAIAPTFAAKIGLAEPEADVDPTFFVDGRGEAIWDALILWILPVAGILLLIDNPAWVYFGLVCLWFGLNCIVILLVDLPSLFNGTVEGGEGRRPEDISPGLCVFEVHGFPRYFNSETPGSLWI